MAERGRSSWLLGIGIAAVVLGLCWIFPPFRLKGLKAQREQSGAVEFDAAAFVEKFWNEKLIPSTGRAVDVTLLLEELHKDPKTAAVRYASSAGLGSTRYYFVKGEGRVVNVESTSILLAVRTESSSAEIILQTGNIFGNAVRDGSGLLNASDFASSLDFNAISSEINRLIEQRVLPELRRMVAVGAKVSFAGFVEMTGDPTDVQALEVVPISAVVQ